MELQRPQGPPSRRAEALSALVAIAGLLACAPQPAAPAPEVPERPNILLITLDTTRADHLGAYGYLRDTTPRLDALAAESLFFEQMLAPMATTLPTHTSLFTGTHPLEHGVMANLKHSGTRVGAPAELQTFAELARRAGYATAAFVSASPVGRGSGVDRGFEQFSAPDGPRSHARRTTRLARTWLEGRRGDRTPWLLWVHLFDPHGPFKPPKELRDAFDEDGDDLTGWLAERAVVGSSARPTGQVLDTVESINAYDGELLNMDARIGELVDFARRGPRRGRTLVVVVGDHGEGLGQHGMAGHGEVWAEQLHAPFFIVSPWHLPRRISHPVSAVDVFPTVLGLIDIPGEEHFVAQSSGVDVLATGPRPQLAVSSPRQLAFGATGRTALTVGRWRYLENTDGEGMLFQRGIDPHELADLATVLPIHRTVMSTWTRQEVEARRVRARELGPPLESAVDEDTVENLRSLGYLGE